MTTTKITYVGGLASGYVQCPKTNRTFPFSRNTDVELPFDIAVALEYQNPSDWKTTDAVKKAAADQRAAEKKAADEIAAKAISDAKKLADIANGITDSISAPAKTKE